MTLLAFSSVGVEVGGAPLFSDASFSVAAGERWGIVGRNGSGKTTLLRLITGAMEPAAGHITRRPGLRTALLDQHRDFGRARTVWEAAARGYGELLELERSLARQGERLARLGGEATQADVESFGRDQERFIHQGGYEFRARVDAVLQGMGFDAQEAWERPPAQLSGGERGRVGLAAQLAAPADLLLLDEPTNHLDLDTIEWLRRYLAGLDAAVMIISHDRAFLDDWADHILHLFQGRVHAYRGGYSSFALQRAQALLALERRVAEQQKLIAREEEYIRRNMAGQKSAQARSRRTRLARLPRLSPPPSEEEAMAVRFEAAARGGEQVLVVEDLAVAAGGRRLLEGFSAVAWRGDVIALVGPNGAGKTTLLATLLGEHPPAGGSVRLGAGVLPAWFRQDHAHLPVGRTLYDCVADLRPAWNRGQIQAHLGRFAFSGDEVRRRTDSLSGGERARVALALITLQGANLLALDEPTNHLDVESIEALEDALEGYRGTVLLVSHDRALLRELATRVWAFRDGRVQDYPGPFVEWEEEVARKETERVEAALQAERESREAERLRSRKAAELRRTRTAPLRAAKREVEVAEGAVHEAEARVAELEAALADPTLYGAPNGEGAREGARLGAALTEARSLLEEAMDRWTRAMEALEGVEPSGS